MAHFAGPAYWVQEGTPHVAPEISDGIRRGVALVGVHQPQAPANDGIYDGYAGPADVLGVHHFHAHPHFETGLLAFCQLGGGSREGGTVVEISLVFIYYVGLHC